MKLGVIYQDNKIINHRSLIKVLFNPILRYFEFQIGTKFKYNELGDVKFEKCSKTNFIKWEKYTLTDNMTLIKKRTLI